MLERKQREPDYPNYGSDNERDDRLINQSDDIDIAPRGWDSRHGDRPIDDPIDAPDYPAWCDLEDDRCATGPRFQGDHPAEEPPDWRESVVPREERFVPVQASARHAGKKLKGGSQKNSTRHNPDREDETSVPAKENLGGRAQTYGGGRTAQHPREENDSGQ